MALVLRPSHKHPCIEAWPPRAFEALAAPLERLDLFSEDHDDLAAALYADACPVESDKEGRIVLPEALVAACWLDRRGRLHGARPHLPDLGAGGRRAPPRRRPASGARAQRLTLPAPAEPRHERMSGTSPSCSPKCCDCLAPRDGGIYLDGTFGGGGYARGDPGRAPPARSGRSTATPTRSRAARRSPRAIPGRLHLIAGQLRRHAEPAGEARRARAGRRRARSRRLVVPDRRPGARLQLPRRRPARHAHGRARADRRRPGEHACPRPSSPTRCTSFGEERLSRRIAKRHRGRARRGADHHHGAARRHHPRAWCRRTAPASTRRRAASRRCASG